MERYYRLTTTPAFPLFGTSKPSTMPYRAGSLGSQSSAADVADGTAAQVQLGATSTLQRSQTATAGGAGTDESDRNGSAGHETVRGDPADARANVSSTHAGHQRGHHPSTHQKSRQHGMRP